MRLEKIIKEICSNMGVLSPEPTDVQLAKIIKKLQEIGSPTESDFLDVINRVISNKRYITEGDDSSSLNALLAKAKEILGNGKN